MPRRRRRPRPGRAGALPRPGSGELPRQPGQGQPLQPQPQPELPAAFSVCLVSADSLFTSLGPQHTQAQSQLVTFSAGVRSSLGIDVIALLFGLFVRNHTRLVVQAGLKASGGPP
jgi:hypothetical protein